MRDTHKLKEKYELSLDNRQIVTLSVASLVVLGGVFMLGVVVGKKLSLEPADKPQADLLTQLDQKSAALDSLNAHEDASLTFQDELTRKTPSVAPSAAVEAPKPVAKPPAPTVASDDDKKPEEKKPTVVAAAEPSTQAAVEPAVVTPEVAEHLPEAPKPEPVPTRTHDAGGLKEAFGKVQKAPTTPAPTQTAADGSWSLQLSAYQDRAEADRFAAGLRDKGYAPFIVEANVPGKGVWFRVRMGRFANKDAASRYLSDFKRETSMNAIVTNQ